MNKGFEMTKSQNAPGKKQFIKMEFRNLLRLVLVKLKDIVVLFH